MVLRKHVKLHNLARDSAKYIFNLLKGVSTKLTPLVTYIVVAQIRKYY